MAKAFKLRDYLKDAGVSESDTAQERIEYIPLDKIDPDPGNFYSLDGLDELAANIETVGLQQPLRVRAAPSDSGRYTVVSGHRRRAALMLIRDGGSDMFKDGVPCIVERGDVSREMQELRLIYANSSTRVLSSAELSRQAERVEELLYKLQEQGVSFPGRMRDHVAAAVNASKSKLARLHAIRNNLDSGLLAEFDAGRVNESVAYLISQEPADIQSRLAKVPAIVRGETAEKIGQIIDRMKSQTNSPAQDLHHVYIDDMGLKNYLAEREAEDEAYFEKLSEIADDFFLCIGGLPSRHDGIEALKNAHGAVHHGGARDDFLFDSSLRGLEITPDGGSHIFRTWTEVYDLLCTIAIARVASDGFDTEQPKAVWKTGVPPGSGRYFARIDMGDGGTHEAVGEYRDGRWSVFGGPLYEKMKVVGWWQLPEK